MEQITNKEILESLNRLEIKMDILIEKLQEEPLMEIDEQLKIGLEELRQGKIVNLN